MKKRLLILSNVALAGLLTMMGCSKKVISDPIEAPEEPIQKAKPDLPPLLYGPPPVKFNEGDMPADSTKNAKEQSEPRIRPDDPVIRPLYGVPPAQFEPIEKK